MPIAQRAEVRRLSGNRSTANVPDSDLDAQIVISDSIVNLYTDKDDWSPTDKEYPALQRASELIASSYIRQRFKEKDESENQYSEAKNLLEIINRKSPLAGKRSVVIARRSYKSYPLNPNGLIHDSIRGRDIGGRSAEGVEPLDLRIE